ncbi:MAG TPA: hemolysin family protein [Myxococcota bacterium]|jgi:putative hemolysin|nr:hemolysin family protein [Myxococcota bacterium]
MIVLELAVVVALVLVNGLFAMVELAVVSASRPRLRALAEEGRKGAAAALRLAESPGRFLSTVQIGITAVGIGAGAFGGATLAERLAEPLVARGLSFAAAEAIALGVVVGGITYLSLVAGELVPKQLALRNAEAIASTAARPMELLSRIASPAVALLDRSTRLVLRLLGPPAEPRPQVTEDEIKALVNEAESAGVVEPEETRMITGVMRLGDRPVRALMTPWVDVDWVDVSAGAAAARRIGRESSHSWLPAVRGRREDVIGAVRSRELLLLEPDAGSEAIEALVRLAPLVPASADALDALARFRASPVHLALVVDEHGATLGVVTPIDILEAIAGGLSSEEQQHPPAVRRRDGSWLLDGWLRVEEASDALGVQIPSRVGAHTVAGFLLYELNRLPRTGDAIDHDGWRFEVVDMDGNRVDKVLAAKIEPGAEEHAHPS